MNKEEEIEEMKEVIRKGFKRADCHNEYTKEPYPYFDSQITAIAECLYGDHYCKAGEVRKETAKEIWEEVLSFCKDNYRSVPDCSWNLDPFLKHKNIIVQVLYERMKSFVKKYGVEVDE